MTGTRAKALLRITADRAVVTIVGARLEAAARAASRLGKRKDAEALHDFRVGIRRLRGALRAYRPWLGKAASRKLRSRLRDLARSTNEHRDTEVQAAWIRTCRPEAPQAVRAELTRLLREMRSPALSQRDLVEEFRAVKAKLCRRLDAVDAVGSEFSSIYAALLTEYVDRAASCLAAIRRPEQVEDAHRARIAVKHLRYLLEPVAPECRPLSAAVKALAALQDVLGELHDAHVFAARLGCELGRGLGPECVAFLHAKNTERRDRSFEALRHRWLGSGTPAQLADIRAALAAALTKN